jgi:hypothetical protein
MSSSTSRLADAVAATSPRYLGLELVPAVLDDGSDLALRHTGALYADRLAGTHRQEQPIALPRARRDAGVADLLDATDHTLARVVSLRDCPQGNSLPAGLP